MSTGSDNMGLFPTGVTPAQAGEHHSQIRIADVAIDAPVDRLYSYVVPDHISTTLAAGMRVRAPMGRKGTLREGFCINVRDGKWDSTLKPVETITDDRILISPALLELGLWISQYYCCPAGTVLQAMVPAAVKDPPSPKTQRWVRLRDAYTADDCELPGRTTAAQKAVITALCTRSDHTAAVADLKHELSCSDSPINTLLKRDVVEADDRVITEDALLHGEQIEPNLRLSDDQRAAMEVIEQRLDDDAFSATLLHGVTGSGKTELYIRAIRRVNRAGKQAIMLIPEIALTTQTYQRLARRFGSVAVMHSALPDRMRRQMWDAIAAGHADVVIGTRSAVFAPVPDLGLIVVDEEQEPSFKNMQTPRFNTRDVATKRAHLQKVPILLGSATPSLESYHNSQTLTSWHYVSLPNRVAGLPMPEVRLVDMRQEHHERKGIHLLSRQLEQTLDESLQLGRQSILLLNRRGYASYVFCPSCKYVLSCPNCKINMVYHKPSDRAVCHHCNQRMLVPQSCPLCRHAIVRFGVGVQRIEEELATRFPQARCCRMDSDTMSRRDDFERVLEAFQDGKYDILIGTQMIAKGLDFPNVWVVGVCSADMALSQPDFRASERTFQLIAQVAGRAGRAEHAGVVVVQSYALDEPAIQSAVTHDYQQFAEQELAVRQPLGLPPYGRLVRFVFSDSQRQRNLDQGRQLSELLQTLANELGYGVHVAGPSPAPVERVRNRWRHQVLVKSRRVRDLQDLLQRLRSDRAYQKLRHLSVDVDPVDLK